MNPGLVPAELHVIVRQVLGEEHGADSIRSGHRLENLVGRAREILRFIRPDEGRPDRLRVIQLPALAGPLKQIFPDRGGITADLVVRGHGKCDHHDLAGQDIIGADRRGLAKDVVDFSAQKSVEEPGVIRDHVGPGPGIGGGVLVQPVVRNQAVLMLADPLSNELLGPVRDI